MPDTPLHEHPAVLHLMGTEHWPTTLNFEPVPYPMRWVQRKNPDGGHQAFWCWLGYDDKPETVDARYYGMPHDVAADLITLAAVRGMWAKGYMPRQWHSPGGINKKACACRSYEDGNFFGHYGTIWLQPTEPLAILAAYQATVMEGGNG